MKLADSDVSDISKALVNFYKPSRNLNYVSISFIEMMLSGKEIDFDQQLKILTKRIEKYDQIGSLFKIRIPNVKKLETIQECPICTYDDNDLVKLHDCGHIFCIYCISQLRNSFCPLCRHPISQNRMTLMKIPEEQLESSQLKKCNDVLQWILDDINQNIKPDSKFVVISSFVENIVKFFLHFQAVSCTYENLSLFRNNKSIKMIVVTPEQVEFGISFVTVSDVYFINPFFQFEHLWKRFHRIGSTVVRPIRFIELILDISIPYESEVVSVQQMMI